MVQEMVDDLTNYNTIGLIEMSSIGAGTVQKLRKELRGRAKIKVAKNTLMKKALELIDGLQGAESLMDQIIGPVAFLFTNDSPYAIANYLENNKVKAPAKGGQISPISVTVPKMNTGEPPGTIISELNSVGLPTRIEGGTVAIPNDTEVLQPGDRVSTTLASILTRLGIEPFEVGLSIALVLEGGEIIGREDLLIDFDQYINEFIYAHQQAVNLSVNAGILTDITAPIVIGQAKQKAMALAASIGYLSDETQGVVFGRAQANMMALARAVMAIDSSALSEAVLNAASAVPVAAASSSTTAETQVEEEEVEEEEEEGEVVEDDGLGGLFG
jgi:large subunit ribosomal protein L10